MRQEKFISIIADNSSSFVDKALQWALQEEEYVAYFTSCGISYPYGAYPQLLAIGALEMHELGDAPFEKLDQLHLYSPDWRFGYFTYDLKNSIHGLKSDNNSSIDFPPCNFFRPKHLIFFEETGIRLQTTADPQQLYNSIIATAISPLRSCQAAKPVPQISKTEYISKVQAIKDHILEGDCYELNLCFEFIAQDYLEDPLLLFRQLREQSPAPFSCFLRMGHQYLISASPERFLKKEQALLISQPIKGTIKRGSTIEQDQQLKESLANSEKEKAENLMIVDLVRNDLARSCSWGSVQVPELFGIYSFRQVHQMISTITGQLRAEVSFTQAIKAAFPMGSMTGAPKRIVMELIDRYENSRRGLYSGSAGFITPAGDFDLNVVIRSLLYDTQNKKLSFSVGGAITWDSDPEQEYQECLLKARAIFQLLNAGNPKEID